MRPKNETRRLRSGSLMIKDANAISNAHSDRKRRVSSFFDGYGKENNILDDIIVEAPSEAELTVILESNFEAQLNSKNLTVLQKEILNNESEEISCGHSLCSGDHRHQAQLRLWLLFEMEIIADGHSNFRSLCYYDQVYKKVDPNWIMHIEPISSEQIPQGYEDFPIQQLLIPTIEINHITQEPRIQDLQIDIGDVLENEHTRIPSSLLAKRNLKSIFDQTPIKAEKILTQGSTSSSEDLREELIAPNEKRCTIFKRLGIMGGLDIPRLPGS